MNSLALKISREHKEKYLEKFSEDDFRDQVVRPLLHRMGYHDGRDLCGPEEHGRDALFAEPRKLGGNRYIGVQTKKGSLNLAAKASKNIIDVTAQLRTALESTYCLISPHKMRIKPDEVILSCSGKVNDAARTHIVEQLGRENQINFLDRDDLISLIDENYPELWLDIEASIQPYLTELKRLAIEDYEHVLCQKILRQPIPTKCLSDEGFIELRLAAPSIKTRRQSGKVYRTPEFEEIGGSDLLDAADLRILILGDPGAGKSTLLLRTAYLAASQAAVAEKQYRVPIVSRAATLICDDLDAFLDRLVAMTRDISGSKVAAFSAEDLEEGRVLLLIDALDEIGSRESRKKFSGLLKIFLEKYPNVKVILTARPYLSVSELGDIGSFKRYRISPISFKQGEKILRAQLRGAEADNSQINEILRKVDQVHGFELNPLLVSIFAATVQYGQSDLPANVTELFKKFAELMLGRWDEQKGLGQQIHQPIKDFLISHIAFKMHSDRVTEIRIEDFRDLGAEELKKRGHSASSNDLLRELIDRSGLFRQVGDRLEFRHHMLQEFFAGRGIPSIETVRSIIHDDWWRRPVIFFFGGRPQDVEGLYEVVTDAHGIDKSRNFEVALTAGLALQACYLGDADEKIHLWKWVASALGLGIESFTESLEDYSKMENVSFLLAHMIAKEAVALGLLVERRDELVDWALNEKLLEGDHCERRLFWAATSMLENADMDGFAMIIDRVKALPIKEQFALFSSCGLIERVRALGAGHKRDAKRFQGELVDSARIVGPDIFRELGAQFLEYRKGKIVAIEEDPD